MKVVISEKNNIVWMRNSTTQEGVASQDYLKDGTQQNIITALEDALLQAKSEMLCRDNGDGVADACASTA